MKVKIHISPKYIHPTEIPCITQQIMHNFIQSSIAWQTVLFHIRQQLQLYNIISYYDHKGVGILGVSSNYCDETVINSQIDNILKDETNSVMPLPHTNVMIDLSDYTVKVSY